MKTLEEITEIFKEELKDDSVELTRESTAADVDGWDSITNTNIVYAIEQKYSIRFKLREILKLKNVGDLVDTINKKLA
ncbi:MAG: acyl carrier protein [Marinifilaceae bacterium]|jgi:acyl carrier protein|nr:acyl carrier protein [Marinifilaceae bacterium]